MATMQKERLRPLTVAEQRELQGIAKASSERVDRVKRATALLAVAGGETFAAASRAAGYRSIGAVTYLVRRFNRAGLDALGIAAGRGRRPTYDATARARIVATAQRPPDRKADGTATWSLSTLERTVRREGLPRVGATTIRRVLHDAGSSYQRTRTWCPTGTAQRKRKAGVVQVVDPQTEEKGGHRAGVPVSRGGRSGAVVPGRGRAVPGDPAARHHLGTGGRAGAPAPRVRAWRDRQAADVVPPRHRRGPRQRRHAGHQRRAPSLAPGGTDRRARDAPTHHPARGRAPTTRALGDLARSRADRAVAAAPAPPDLGQSGRPPELVHRPLAIPTRRHAAVHPDQRLLAQSGRVGPTDHRPPRPRRSASPVPGRADHLARRHRRRLERPPDLLRLAR